MKISSLMITLLVLAGISASFGADFEKSVLLAESDVNLEMKAMKADMQAAEESRTSVAPLQTLAFDCKLGVVAGAAFQEPSFRLSITGDDAVLRANGQEYKGKLDASYKPRGNKDMVRFIGFNIGLVLVQKQMLSGASGYIKIQERNGEDFFDQRGQCEAMQTAAAH